MANLSELKSEYLKQLKISKIDLESLDTRTKYMQEGVVNAAKQKISGLKPQVMQLVLTNSTTIFVNDNVNITDAAQELSQKQDNINVIDFLELEKKILQYIAPKSKTDVYYFNSETVSRINIALFDLRNLLGATYIPPVSLPLNERAVIDSESGAILKLQSMLKKALGSELKTLFLAKQMNDFADSKLADFDKMVFFVVNVNESTESLTKITGQNVIITTEDEVENDAASVQKAVSNKIKSQKKKLTQTNT